MADNRLSQIRVLLVDDEMQILRLVSDVLTQFGFKDITMAHNGREAIELISKQRFDFIITDWRMPEVEGIDVIKFVRTAPESPAKRVPIIMLSGNTEATYVIQARNAGVNEYVIKPFTAEQLIKRLRAIIENPRSFVDAPNYHGPSRRWHATDQTPPVDRRKRRDPK